MGEGRVGQARGPEGHGVGGGGWGRLTGLNQEPGVS